MRCEIGKLSPCRCGSKTSQIVRQLTFLWTVYCNSCGRNKNEVYGNTRAEAMANWNAKQV